jgi:hypothetical protein
MRCGHQVNQRTLTERKATRTLQPDHGLLGTLPYGETYRPVCAMPTLIKIRYRVTGLLCRTQCAKKQFGAIRAVELEKPVLFR